MKSKSGVDLPSRIGTQGVNMNELCLSSMIESSIDVI